MHSRGSGSRAHTARILPKRPGGLRRASPITRSCPRRRYRPRTPPSPTPAPFPCRAGVGGGACSPQDTCTVPPPATRVSRPYVEDSGKTPTKSVFPPTDQLDTHHTQPPPPFSPTRTHRTAIISPARLRRRHDASAPVTSLFGAPPSVDPARLAAGTACIANPTPVRSKGLIRSALVACSSLPSPASLALRWRLPYLVLNPRPIASGWLHRTRLLVLTARPRQTPPALSARLGRPRLSPPSWVASVSASGLGPVPVPITIRARSVLLLALLKSHQPLTPPVLLSRPLLF